MELEPQKQLFKESLAKILELHSQAVGPDGLMPNGAHDAIIAWAFVYVTVTDGKGYRELILETIEEQGIRDYLLFISVDKLPELLAHHL